VPFGFVLVRVRVREGNRGLILQGWTYRELPADLGRIRW